MSIVYRCDICGRDKKQHGADLIRVMHPTKTTKGGKKKAWFALKAVHPTYHYGSADLDACGPCTASISRAVASKIQERING